MRTRVLRGLAVMVLAVAVALPGTASPAHAANGSSDTIITVVFSVFRLFDGLTSSDVERLVREAIDAVDAAEHEVIVHLDALEAADAKADARWAAIEFADYDLIRQNWFLLPQFASEVGQKATKASVDLTTVADPRAADQIGHALNVMYPIAMVATEEAGRSGALAGYTQDYIEANEYILDELKPACSSQTESTGSWSQTTYECVAANGDRAVGVESRDLVTGEWLAGPVDVGELREEAAADSSWMVAKQALEADTP